MKPARLVLLPAGDGPAIALDFGADCAVTARQRLEPGRPPAAARGPTVLAVPAEVVHLAWLDIDARTDAQALAAARVLLAERLATPAAGLHVAVARAPHGACLVAAMDRGAMSAWLAQAEALGVAADRIVPDCLLLPAPAHPREVVVVAQGDRSLVRGAAHAFSAETPLADVVLAGHSADVEIRTVPAAESEAMLAAAAAAAPIDLRNDAHASAGNQTGRRHLRLLVAAALLSPLLLLAADAARYAWSAARVRDASIAAASSVLGGAPDSPVQAVAEARDALSAAPRLARALGALSQAVESTPGTRIENIQYSRGAGIGALVRHGAPGDIAALDAALHPAGFALGVEGSDEASDGDFRTQVRVEALQ